MSDKKPEVRWIDTNTGEIKMRQFHGRDPVVWAAASPHNPTDKPWFDGEFEEWEVDSLDMALAWVPDLQTICDMARIQNKTLEIRVRLVEL